MQNQSKTNFKIISRIEAELLKDKDLQPDTILISIYGFDEKPANLKVSCPILRLQFDDIEQRPEHCHNNVKRSDLIRACFLPFDNSMAKLIFDFVNAHCPKHIIVHCHAGICRSAAVAAALSKIMYDEDDYIFKSRVPNMLVYTTMLEFYYCDQYELTASQFLQQQAYTRFETKRGYK